jgi:hypothetical protein
MGKLIEAMVDCPQTKDMNVFEHGVLVHEYFLDLYENLKDDKPLEKQWRLPSWYEDNKELLLNGLLDFEILKTYQIYHDCGKPFCRIVDESGKQHFPNHASVSADTWYQITQDKQVSELMRMDMDIHLLKADGVDEFSTRREAISLLLTGLSEIHANASMFGGLDSVSFKIKKKNIFKRGKNIIDYLLKNKI